MACLRGRYTVLLFKYGIEVMGVVEAGEACHLLDRRVGLLSKSARACRRRICWLKALGDWPTWRANSLRNWAVLSPPGLAGELADRWRVFDRFADGDEGTPDPDIAHGGWRYGQLAMPESLLCRVPVFAGRVLVVRL